MVGIMLENEKKFSVSWDRGMWILNLLIFAVNAGLVVMFLVIASRGSQEKVAMTAAAMLVIVVTFLPAVWAPIKYIVTDNEIIIKRIGPDVKIPFTDISAVNRMPYSQVFKGAIRTCGNGGLFAIYGNFKSPSMDKFRAYMTRRDKLVVISTSDKPIVLTPDALQEFINAVNLALEKRS